MTREEILQAFDDINFVYNDCTKYDTLKRMLEELTEHKHGEWEPLDTTSTSRRCSACGFVFGDVRMITQSPSTTIIKHDYNFAFCPMCGTKMDL